MDYARDSGYGGYVLYSIPVRSIQRRTEVVHTPCRLPLLGRVGNVSEVLEVMDRFDVGVEVTSSPSSGGSGAIGV